MRSIELVRLDAIDVVLANGLPDSGDVPPHRAFDPWSALNEVLTGLQDVEFDPLPKGLTTQTKLLTSLSSSQRKRIIRCREID